jgi:hypothetical protein
MRIFCTRKHSQYFFKQLLFEQWQPATCALVGVTLLVKAVGVRCIVAAIATFRVYNEKVLEEFNDKINRRKRR